jgi:uncharacterized protein
MDSQTKEALRSIRTAIKEGKAAETLALLTEDKSRLRMMTPFGSWLHVAAKVGNLDGYR